MIRKSGHCQPQSVKNFQGGKRKCNSACLNAPEILWNTTGFFVGKSFPRPTAYRAGSVPACSTKEHTHAFFPMWNAASLSLWWAADTCSTLPLKSFQHNIWCLYKQTICQAGKNNFGSLPSARLKACPTCSTKCLILHLTGQERLLPELLSQLPHYLFLLQ